MPTKIGLLSGILLGRDFVVCTAILAALFFVVPPATSARGGSGSGGDGELLNALNTQIQAQGPVPGSVAEDIPEAEACAQMEDVNNELSDGQSNTPDCGPVNLLAVETDKLNETLEVTGESINQANFAPDEGSIDVPTGAKPSPLFGADPFTMQMLREEEFGPVPLGEKANMLTGPEFPLPTGAESGPLEGALDDFLGWYINPTQASPYPWPMQYANDPDNDDYLIEAGVAGMQNSWKLEIEEYIGRKLNTPPLEGRPPGEDWAHQRWDEFYPQAYFNTATAGARTNTGLRDTLQSHDYNSGEWAEGGLYYDTASFEGVTYSGEPGKTISGTTGGITVQFHPKFPPQDPNALWTFDGTFPPKVLRARIGEPILMRHYNALPVDPAANYGFGLHTLTTHEHNGHNPAESDGYTQAFFFPGQFYDYHWPMVVAGTDHINTDASEPRAATPCSAGEILNVLGQEKLCSNGTIQIPGDYKEIMSTHWFHDHMLDFTAQNVYKGSAAMMNYYSAIDRGKEEYSESKCHYQNPNNVNLCLPSGKALDWGNRDYDINLMLSDKAWDADGQLFFNIFNTDGFLGDQILSNLTWKPYFKVRARRYRFRILNASVSRYFRIALVELVNGTTGELPGPQNSGISYNRVPFYMIGNDGNLMQHAVHFDGTTTVAGYKNRKGILPTIGIAERYDVIVDFARFVPTESNLEPKLYFVNLLEHQNGRRPNKEIPLGEILNGKYHQQETEPANQPVPGLAADQPVPGDGYISDPTVSRFLELRVQSYAETDRSLNPADYIAGRKKMTELPEFTEEELATAKHRTFEFARSSGTDTSPWTIKTDGGAGLNMDPRRLSAAPNQNQVEIWHIEGNGGWSHPVHVHFEEGKILTRGGKPPPEWEKWARKDVYRIGRMDDSTDSVTIAIRFREFLGSYMEHCHNTQHEDHAMLLRWDVESPGQVRVMPTPMPTWDGVGYVPSTALPTFRIGDVNAALGVGTFQSAEDPPVGESLVTNSDTIIIDRAEYNAVYREWEVRGESSGVKVTIWLGPSNEDEGGELIAENVAVDSLGEFRIKKMRGPAPTQGNVCTVVSSSPNAEATHLVEIYD